jgi:hypothetical protein
VRIDRDLARYAGAPLVGDHPIDESEKGEILPDPNVPSGMDRRSDLPDENASGGDALPSIDFDASALRIGVAPVTCTAGTFLMSHREFLGSADDVGDLESRKRLPVPALTAVILPAPKLEDDHFRAEALANDFGLDLRPAHERSAELRGLVGTPHKQHLWECYGIPHVAGELLHAEPVSRRDSILLSACREYRVHRGTLLECVIRQGCLSNGRRFAAAGQGLGGDEFGPRIIRTPSVL